jgi:hypothetical protein
MKASRWFHQYCGLASVSTWLAIAIAQAVFSFFCVFLFYKFRKRDRFFPVSRQSTLHSFFLQTVWVYPMARKFILLQELWMLFVPLLRMGRRLGGAAPSGQTEFSSSRRPLYVGSFLEQRITTPGSEGRSGSQGYPGRSNIGCGGERCLVIIS